MSIAEKFEVIADEVYEKGKSDFKDLFAKGFTNNGARTYYSYAFRTASFNADNVIDFKGMCKPIEATQMFYNMKSTHLPIGIDMSNIDVSNQNVIDQLFAYSSKLLELPDFNIPATKRIYNTYSYCYALHTIHGKVRVNADTTYTNPFKECNALQNIEIEGTIGQNGFNVQWSTKLTVKSLLSILTALSKDSSIASGKSITFATVHKDIIEGDSQCLEQYNLAISAGWTIAYA